MSSELEYWHGGVRGLQAGELILPPDETGAPTAKDFMSAELVGHVRTDRVFVTTDMQDAMVFGAMYPHKKGGWLYQVEPLGELEVDPDFVGDDKSSFQCERARILIARPVPLSFIRGCRQAAERLQAELGR